MNGLTQNNSIKRKLLCGASAVVFCAMAGGAANAATEVISGTTAAGATNVTEASPTTLDINADNVFGEIDANGNVTFVGTAGETTGTIDVDGTATIFVFDSDAAAANTLTINADADGAGEGSINIAAGKTLTISVGQDGDGANKNAVNLTLVGAVVGADATSILNITTNADAANTISLGAATDMSTGTITLNNDSDSVVIAGGANLTGNIDNGTGTAGKGTLTYSGGADTTITGTIGATNSLKAITADVTGEGADALAFSSTVAATTITITGTNDADEVKFNGDVTGNIAIVDGALITVAADKTITGSVTTTDTDGVLTFGTATVAKTLVSGSIGATGADLSVLNVATGAGITSTISGNVFAETVNVTGTGTLALGGTVTSDTKLDFQAAATVTAAGDITTALVDFGADGTLTMAANKKIVGAVSTTAADGNGTLTFTATTTDTTLVSGAVGAAANDLKAINVAPASGVTVTFGGAVEAQTVTTSGAGTLKFGSTFKGAGVISGGGTIDAVDSITGSVDNTGTDGTGTLTLAAGKTISGAVGATNALATVNLNSTGNIALGGAIKATTVNVGGTGVATFNGDVTGNVNFTAAGTVTLGADEKVVGSVTTSADGQGTLTITTNTAATTYVSGDVGSSSAALLALNVAPDAGVVSTFDGNVFARTITLTAAAATDGVNFKGNITAATALNFAADGILNLNGTTAQSITGPITATITNNGDITVNNTAGVTFTGKIGVNGANEIGDITLATGTKTTFQETVDAQTLILTGTANVTVNKAVTLIGALNTANGNVVNLGSAFVGGTTVFNPGDSTAVLDQTAGAVTVNPNAAFTSGTVTLLANGATLDAADLASFTVVDSALVDYSLALANTDNDIAITATKKSAATTASELGVSTQEATALGNANDALATGDAAAQTAMDSALSSGGAVARLAAETVGIQSDTLGANSAASIGTGVQVIGVASDRLALMRSITGEQFAAANQTGFASGDGAMNKAFWARGFGNWTKQDDRGGVAGFDADTLGMSGGVDAQVSDNSRIGVSLSYADTSVDGKGTGSAKTDIASYQATIYGDYSTDTYFVEGSLGYARNSNETSRTVLLPGLTRTATADFDSNQYMANAKAGMPIAVGSKSFFTPTVGASYTKVTSDTYTETGAGNLNLTVNPDDVDAFVVSLGGQFHTRIEQGKGFIVPMVRAGVSYDLSGDEAVATGTYTGGGASFTSTGAEVEQLSGNVGFGLTYETDMWSVGANYDLDAKSDYRSHSAKIETRIKF